MSKRAYVKIKASRDGQCAHTKVYGRPREVMVLFASGVACIANATGIPAVDLAKALVVLVSEDAGGKEVDENAQG